MTDTEEIHSVNATLLNHIFWLKSTTFEGILIVDITYERHAASVSLLNAQRCLEVFTGKAF